MFRTHRGIKITESTCSLFPLHSLHSEDHACRVDGMLLPSFEPYEAPSKSWEIIMILRRYSRFAEPPWGFMKSFWTNWWMKNITLRATSDGDVVARQPRCNVAWKSNHMHTAGKQCFVLMEETIAGWSGFLPRRAAHWMLFDTHIVLVVGTLWLNVFEVNVYNVKEYHTVAGSFGYSEYNNYYCQ